MTKLADYRDNYEFVALERDEGGVLTMQLHRDGGKFVWGLRQHDEVTDCLAQISRDHGNKVVIVTGTGDAFLDESEPVEEFLAPRDLPFPELLSQQLATGYHLIRNHLDVPVPMIGLVNGPATWHAELVLLCDIVLCAEHACFQDFPHFPSGIVPGDGVHIVYPELLGINRGRSFLLMGEKIHAEEAKRLGLVAEVLPLEMLEARGREIAADIAKRDAVFLRNTRSVLVQKLRREVADLLPLGLQSAYGAAMAGVQGAE